MSVSDRYDFELAVAVQKALLDCELPQCHCGKFAFESRMIEEIGGDLYHFRQLGNDQIALTIGDVMGHGVGAALIMSMIIGLLQADRTDNRRPDRVVTWINDLLLRLGRTTQTPILCSLFYGIIDLPSGLLLYINAGHPVPIIYNKYKHTIQHLPTTSMVLGVQEMELTEHCHQFNSKDRLFLFTDGIIEARNEQFEFYGEDRLTQLIASQGDIPAKDISHNIFEYVSAFCRPASPDDDMTLVVIDFDQDISPGL